MSVYVEAAADKYTAEAAEAADVHAVTGFAQRDELGYMHSSPSQWSVGSRGSVDSVQFSPGDGLNASTVSRTSSHDYHLTLFKNVLPMIDEELIAGCKDAIEKAAEDLGVHYTQADTPVDVLRRVAGVTVVSPTQSRAASPAPSNGRASPHATDGADADDEQDDGSNGASGKSKSLPSRFRLPKLRWRKARRHTDGEGNGKRDTKTTGDTPLKSDSRNALPCDVEGSPGLMGWMWGSLKPTTEPPVLAEPVTRRPRKRRKDKINEELVNGLFPKCAQVDLASNNINFDSDMIMGFVGPTLLLGFQVFGWIEMITLPLFIAVASVLIVEWNSTCDVRSEYDTFDTVPIKTFLIIKACTASMTWFANARIAAWANRSHAKFINERNDVLGLLEEERDLIKQKLNKKRKSRLVELLDRRTLVDTSMLAGLEMIVMRDTILTSWSYRMYQLCFLPDMGMDIVLIWLLSHFVTKGQPDCHYQQNKNTINMLMALALWSAVTIVFRTAIIMTWLSRALFHSRAGLHSWGRDYVDRKDKQLAFGSKVLVVAYDALYGRGRAKRMQKRLVPLRKRVAVERQQLLDLLIRHGRRQDPYSPTSRFGYEVTSNVQGRPAPDLSLHSAPADYLWGPRMSQASRGRANGRTSMDARDNNVQPRTSIV